MLHFALGVSFTYTRQFPIVGVTLTVELEEHLLSRTISCCHSVEDIWIFLFQIHIPCKLWTNSVQLGRWMHSFCGEHFTRMLGNIALSEYKYRSKLEPRHTRSLPPSLTGLAVF
jgi:hypothetical protein